jgi:diguanylate cyclase (GGDEF)-like protein
MDGERTVDREHPLVTDQGSEHQGATLGQVSAAEKHAYDAARRDQIAKRRDLAAEDRDQAAEERESELAELEDSLGSERSPALERLLIEHKKFRLQAALDRESAAEDRGLAERDRERACEERVEALEALRNAHFDELTGAHRRGLGEDLLRAEIERARRSDGKLVLAFIDVDNLKQVNDAEGHHAGDQLLRDLVDAIRANIRSYSPIIRLGGDEFAFAIGGLDAPEMEERCAVIRADLARRPSGGTITVGVAELRPEDDSSDLLRRADAALVAARADRSRAQTALHD